MFPRHRLDLGLGDLGYGLVAGVRPVDAERTAAALFARVGVTGLVTLSVRSAWDLLLSVLDWPPGSEVVVSAITHPEMVALLAAHDVRAVPVDVDPVSLAPDPAALERAVTDRTRAVLVVHLFGGRVDLTPVADLARRLGLLLVVDAAQAFTGPESLRQDHDGVSLYSFGLIKTASAVGGALLVTRDPDLLAALEQRHRSWPVQPRLDYARRLLRAAALLLLSRPGVYTAFFALAARLGRDPDTLINTSTRSFAGPLDTDPGRLARLRHRPAPALVALLARRLQHFDPTRLDARRAVGERVAAALPPGTTHPGDGLQDRTHWLFPVVVDDPRRLVAELRRAGLDASQATSNLGAVAGPDRPAPPRAAALMGSVVYLPVYPELPESGVVALIGALHRHAVRSRSARSA